MLCTVKFRDVNNNNNNLSISILILYIIRGQLLKCQIHLKIRLKNYLI